MESKQETYAKGAAAEAANILPLNLPAVTNEVDDESRMMASWDGGASNVRSNLDLTTEEGERLLVKAMGNSELSTRSVVGQEIDVVGYLAHVAELTNAGDGEVTRRPRVVMLLADGRTVSTMSAGCVRVLRYLAGTRGPGRWDVPARLKVSVHPLPEGRSYCTMELLRDQDGAVKPKKK